MRVHSRAVTLLLATLLVVCAFSATLAESEYRLESVLKESAGGSVRYVQLSGAPNAFAQDVINRAIVEIGEIDKHLTTLQTAADADVLTVSTNAEILLSQDGRDILSALVTAHGRMPNGRTGQRYTPMTFDITSGAALTAADIFTDVAVAQDFLDGYIAERVEPELSNYIDAGEMYPAPIERFRLTREGVTFYYPQNQLTLLSGFSGAVHLYHSELAALYDMSDGSVMQRVYQNTAPSADGVKAACETGALARVLGEDLVALVESKRVRLAADADFIPGGSLYIVEDAVFRGAWLMTDAQSDDLTGQTVTGVRAVRADVGGLIVGVSTLDDCRGALGTPQSSVTLDEATAASYRLPAGTSEYYAIAPDRALRLHFDDARTLCALEITITR